jgi:hypothetical protein
MRGRSRAAGAAALVCGALGPVFAGAAVPSWAGTVRVNLSIPAPARLDLQGMRKVLVTRFVVDKDLEEIDLNREVVKLLRRDLRKNTPLEVLDVEPPGLPEQPLADLLANTGFWRRLAETTGADLILSGKVSFDISDRSGYVQVDEISPVTGQRVRRTRFVDREGFELALNLFVIRGSTGQILYEDRFTGANTLPGGHNDRLTVLYTLFEQFEDDVLGILVPRPRSVQRFLFTD